MSGKLERECEQVAQRVRSLQIHDFRYRVEGDRVILEGQAFAPETIDSAVKAFAATAAREVVSRLVTSRGGEGPHPVFSRPGYVEPLNLGPNAGRLAETVLWEVRLGDTLASIARTFYGDAAKAEVIARANAARIGPGGHLTIGERLRMPLV